ncbi:hypothetical protein GCM10017764_35840 [Sphingobacterium griseoflavum]|uniref:Thioredoxin domain-containing protein n=1 Tax=Sphingobacterium griseoflavum TaxID=1474952 RepID=A0ABQ3HZ61_9SPHI|nr:hypothetical protein GCM10017764_35840 [Sphingobacterium griseoflavum]
MALLCTLFVGLRRLLALVCRRCRKRQPRGPRPTMRILPLLLGAMLLAELLAPLALAAQHEAQAHTIAVGDTLPEAFWDMPLQLLQVGQAPREGSLRDYADSELLLLDFWHTSCGSCISSMRHAEALQAQFKGQLQVLAVTVQDAATVQRFAAHNDLLQQSRLPLVLHDSLLKSYFPHRLLPHLVFIRHNRLQHIGGSEAMDEAAIAALLNDRDSSFALYKDDFAEQRPLLAAANTASEGRLYYSLLTGYRRDAAPVVGLLPDTLGGSKRLYRYNQSLQQLLSYALDSKPVDKNRIVFEDTELNLAATAYHRHMGDKLQWLLRHGYCYEAQLPLHTPDSSMRQGLLISIEQALGLRCSLAQREIPVLRLEAPPGASATPKEGYVALFYLIDAYNRMPNALPLLDPDGLAQQWFVERQSLADCTAEQLLAAMRKAGLQLCEERATLPVWLIKGRGAHEQD